MSDLDWRRWTARTRPGLPALKQSEACACHRTTVSGRTMASAPQALGNSWPTQPGTALSTAKNDSRLVLPRRSTMTCYRNTTISASNATRGRTRSTTIQKIILQRSNIPQKITRFCVSHQLHGVYDRNRSRSYAQIYTGILENLFISPDNLTQGWLLSQKISLVGEIQLVSSIVPALTNVRLGKAAVSVTMGDPQSGQKRRSTALLLSPFP